MKEAEAEEDKQISVPEILVTNNITTPVATATATTQTDTDELHNNTITAKQTNTDELNNNTTAGAATQTKTEEVSLKSLLDKAEERLGEHINEMGSNILCQILPLLQNIQQEMKELIYSQGAQTSNLKPQMIYSQGAQTSNLKPQTSNLR